MSLDRMMKSAAAHAVLWVCCGIAHAAEPAAPAPAPSQQQLEQQLEAARERLDAAAREVGELSEQLGQRAGNIVIQRFGGPPARSMLGVQVQRGSGGARVMAVSPGGPAEAAGIKVGDVITAIGGADIASQDDPGRALVERMRDLEPGLKVKVAVQRDGKKMEFDVTPREAPQALVFRGMPAMPGVAPAPFVRPAPDVEMRGVVPFNLRREEAGERFRGMEFATLSERLGSYFGVKSGVLVVRAGSNNAFELQDGDVILAIDGREPASVAHATRILRSYQAGEKLTLRVQRDRRAQSIEVTVPGRNRDRDRD